MSDYPLISVIVPFYNEEQYLEKCIKSIISQTYKNIEVILVDDGSTDKSTIISELFVSKDFRVRAIHQKNAGLVRARKTGVQVAQGDYITYVDGDDWIDEDRYMVMYERGLREGVDIVASDVLTEYGNGYSKIYNNGEECVLIGETVKQILKNWMSQEHFYQPIYFTSLCKHLYKRELIVEAQFSVDDHIWMGEDTVVHLQCLMKASSFANVHGAYYHYRKDSLSMTVSAKYKDSYADLVYDTLYFPICMCPEKEALLKSLKAFTYLLLLLSDYEEIMEFYKESLFPYRKVKENSRIVVYGTGGFGRCLLSYLLKTDYSELVMVCGADYGKTIFVRQKKLVIENPDKIAECEFDYIVITATHYEVAEEITCKLLGMGISENKICTIDDYGMLSDDLLGIVLESLRRRNRGRSI